MENFEWSEFCTFNEDVVTEPIYSKVSMIKFKYLDRGFSLMRKKRRKWGFKEEIHRKIIHLASILFLLIYILFFNWYDQKVALMVLSALLIIMLELEYFRVERAMKVPIVSWLWKYRRTKEKSSENF